MKQTNKNFLFNVGYQLLMYVFPLVAAGYVSRVLGSENVGIYSYVNSIVSTFGLFCLLGIANYGNREIAKVRDDQEKRQTVFSSIYTLQLILSAVVIAAYVITVWVVPFENKDIFWIQGVFLLSVACDVTWLFFGLEKFKITLSRNFFVKVLSTILIILFVKEKNDLWVYTLIMMVSTAASQMFMLMLSGKDVRYHPASWKASFSHLKACCVLFVPVVAFSVYRIMDKAMIGALSSKVQLGYYENADKIIYIPVMVISALGTVMMPHMAHAMHNNSEDYKKTIAFSMKLALSIAAFATGGLVAVGKDLAVLIFGQEFLFSGTLIAVLACTIIASAWANVIRTQYLIPKSLDKIYVLSTIVGAVVNVVFNAALIKPFGALGACAGTILAEFSIAVVQTIGVRKELPIGDYLKSFIVILAKASLMVGSIMLLGLWLENMYLRLAVQIAVALALFVVLNWRFLKEFFGIGRKNKG